jgi:hypothetical protein
MSDFVPLNDSTEKRFRRALFIDLIQLAPEGSKLLITQDSWAGIPDLLGPQLAIESGNWVVALTPSTREFLVQQAHSRDFQITMVHFYIRHQERDVVTSYDCMCGLLIDPAFPDYARIIREYAPLGSIMT